MRERIKRHPNYYIDEDGNVYRKDRHGYFLLVPDYSNGYARVDLDGIKEYIAKLVLETFNPSNNDSLRVFYIDGDTTNCSLSNMTWLSPSEIQLYSQYTVDYRIQILSRGAR